ncbi:signal recognition particle-docking protein FtsY [Candidatus Pacearchaeota archaeon]|nr:signal recognition particle-docking protein FtsY [Candidatus Pacearchaeota archaeon]
MFKFLKEKLSGWFGKKEEKEKIVEVKEKKHKVKAGKKEKSAKKIKEKEKIEEKAEPTEDRENEEVKRELAEAKSEIKEEKELASEVLEEGEIFELAEKGEKDVELVEEESGEKVIEEEKKEEIVAEEKSDKAKKQKREVEKAEEGEKIKEGKEEKRGFFAKLLSKIKSSKLTEEEFNSSFSEFEMELLESNVALDVVDKIREKLSRELVEKQFKRGEAEQRVFFALREAIEEVLIEAPDLVEKIKGKKGEFVILFFGINGTGKTTTIAKLAYKLEKEGLKCVLAAGDTFRAASIEQLEQHAEKLRVPIVKNKYMSDPAAVAFDAIQYAKKNHIKVVLIDSAGRMHTKENLMKEMEKIARVAKPDLKIFVGEAITGNDVAEQVKAFNDSVGIDGIILTKADVDEKAGTILSVGYITGKPIYYLGVGQKYEDLREFKKEYFIKGLGLEAEK